MFHEVNPLDLDTMSRHGVSDPDLLALQGRVFKIAESGVGTALVELPDDGGTVMVPLRYLRPVK